MENQPAQDAPGATPEAAKSAEIAFRFPPIADKTLCFQLPSGDVWMGFNPAKFPLRVVLAWSAFQVEQYYALFMDRMRDAQAKAHEPKPKRGIRDIILGK